MYYTMCPCPLVQIKYKSFICPMPLFSCVMLCNVTADDKQIVILIE